jgi:hypothetical protein
MRVYLDTCCYNRPFDDQSQHRIRLETTAILAVFGAALAGELSIVGSEILDLEVHRISDPVRRRDVTSLASLAIERILLASPVVARARRLEGLGFRPADALNLSCAEAGAADALLTPDDRFWNTAQRVQSELTAPVQKPIPWLMERLS